MFSKLYKEILKLGQGSATQNPNSNDILHQGWRLDREQCEADLRSVIPLEAGQIHPHIQE